MLCLSANYPGRGKDREMLMDQWLFEQIQKITPEEQAYLDGKEQVDREIYTRKENFEIDSQMFLQQGKLLTIRHHSRFIEFPEHKHNYIEIVYVCAGEIVHYIDGKVLSMHTGDIYMSDPSAETAGTGARCCSAAASQGENPQSSFACASSGAGYQKTPAGR